jgi:hypothetical protein
VVSRLRKDGAQGNLELAFDARFRDIEREWRRHLRDEAGPRSDLGGRLVEQPHEDGGARHTHEHPRQ